MKNILNLFTSLRVKLGALIAFIFFALLTLLSFKTKTIKEKKEKIKELKKDLKTFKKVTLENEKVQEFNTRQKVKKEVLEKEFKDEKDLLKKYESNPPVKRKYTV